MPRINSIAWSVWNALTAARMNAVNSDLDDLYALGSDRLKIYHLAADAAFLVRIGAGNYRVGTAEGVYAGGSVTVGASVTTYFMINSSGTIVTNTTGFVGTNAKLGTVVTNASAITAINIFKVDAIGGDLGGAGFNNITATTYKNGLLTAFTSDGVSWTINYTWRRVKNWTNGSNTWTPTYWANGVIVSTAKT